VTTVGTLDDGYFTWLYSQVASVRNENPNRSYWHLLRHLYSVPFTWHVSRDDNRCVDGQELRHEWIVMNNVEDADRSWLSLDCSFLEMLVALARRTAFESSGEPVDWFWKLMTTIGLRQYNDAHWTHRAERETYLTVDRIVNRKYAYDGEGGLFPLRHPRHDQRQVELWAQMQAYILEGGYLDRGPDM
jgi:hypothetical protein